MNEYSPREEKLNIFSHAIGFALSILALILMLYKSVHLGSTRQVFIVGIFGVSLTLLYAASTLYHSAVEPETRSRLKIFDHSAIYILIAGTYTPFTLITLNDSRGWLICGLSWGMAFIGIVVKYFFTGKYKSISTIMYVLMGWMIVFALKPLIAALPSAGIDWLVAGGVSYTVGAVFYSIKKIKFNHAIFHVFVLIGSFCHFCSVYFYVLMPS